MKNLGAPFDQLPAGAVTLRSVAESSRLFRQGDKPGCFYFLEQGEVTLTRITAAGDEVVMHTAYSGETFAEAALFSEQYHCDAFTKLPCRLWEIDKQAVMTLSRQDSEFSLQLTARFARQVQALRRHKELLAVRSASERVYLAMAEGLLQSNIKQFSASIGLTHEATYRALSELVAAGRVVKRGRGEYIFPNT